MDKYIPIAALLLDTAIGDPRSRFHPVVLIGKFIAFLEARLLKKEKPRNYKIAAGTLLVCLVLALTYASAWLILDLLNMLGPMAAFIGGAVMLSFTISPRSLAEAGNEIKDYMLNGDLNQARCKVGWIVGRDTDKLDTSEITRATVETVAENIVDGIISPLFYFAIGGAPLAFLYRAVNTLDSMVGYKNTKYIDFGMPAARLDDLFNYIPARITGILIIIVAFFLRYNGVSALKSIRQDAPKHPSPNSGLAEAGVAGALGIRLGGLNYYGGVASFRSYMGTQLQKLEPTHIEKTIKIMYGTTLLFIFLLTLI
ncbi:Cobalamin biosynthesis protein CobD [bioreactor metagenome]|uniref:Cobalamin biosynthesis protein CobD n=1 Tax=bioreactor metagenome TaxID=1076179 RepID=A0A644T3G1_9ZZZZ|nr:adenosylcobinamide-phosphate synthase CbiB [Negativicutes bacterium]